MDHSHSAQRPSFFWQGSMIILPVAVLAVVGLFSLRQDEQAAEQAARQRAAEDAQSLAHAVGDMANQDLSQFVPLQNVWMGDLRIASQASASLSSDEYLKSGISKWERTYPSLRIADLASPMSTLMADGRELDPPELPVTASPPKWYCDLSTKQRELWEALQQDPRAAQTFLDTNPSSEARQAALALARPPEQILNDPPPPLSESGVSYRDLACYRLLNYRTALTVPVLDMVWHRLFDQPSFVAPALLDLAERKTNGADAVVQEKIRLMRQFWDSESTARRYLAPLQRLPEIRSGSTNSPWAHWSLTPSDRALALFSFCLFKSTDKDGKPLTERGWLTVFVPGEVLEAIFARAMAENQFLVPAYAVVSVAVENEPVSSPGGNAQTDKKSLLASVTRKFGPFSLPDAATLNVSFYLTSREKMLEAERHRAHLFGALIGAAVLAALAGLLTARRAFYQQHRLSEMKTNFVSSVSHELRAPIASMRLLAEALERGKIPDADRQREYYRFLVQESRRLTSLIENVLDFSRIEQGRKEYRFEPADLNALAVQTVQLMLPCAVERQVGLSFQPLAEPLPMEHGDGLALQQALINLIDNGIKHSPPGATVTVGLEPNGAACRLWVEDSGPGIPPEEHEKIFERFYRRGSELRRETQGIGIGLTIVKHIVEAHGGRVQVRSAVGQGSRFTIELPTGQERKE